MKEFKAESKKLLDLMINSIYTNKEIFMRELISNASDAIDKLYYKSLTDQNVKISKEDLSIKIDINKEEKTISISDTGIGMNSEELEKDLGTIARSGSLAFKEANEKKEDIDIIGQFGVGFYSAFMVSDKVIVESKAYGEDKAYRWVSEGANGYNIEECEKEDFGTKIILKLKEDTEDEKYSRYLEEYTIKNIIKKYSDYIRYPIKMDIKHSHKKENSENEYEEHIETEVLNSMIPLWNKKKSEVTEKEYDDFYMNKFYDFEKPMKVIHNSLEGTLSYKSMLFIPSHMPYDFYTKEYEKGLELYSNGVLIMEKCSDLLPDYFSFVKGLVDSPDLSLNISREMLQQDRTLKTISKNIEKKILSELSSMLKNEREEYDKLFKTFGIQLKFGTYNDYGMNKDKLKDLLMFYSSLDKKLVTLDEYVSRMKEGQDKIYYACSESLDKIEMLPQVELALEKGYEILYLVENIDEFVLKVLEEYNSKKFVNISSENLDFDNEEEKENLKKSNEENKDMFKFMKDAIESDVEGIRFTHRLKNHPVCLTSEGNVSIEMEKVINKMPTDEKVKAKTILEINENHDIAKKIKNLYIEDKNELKEYTKVLYSLAKLIEGLEVDNIAEISSSICNMISK